MYMISIEISRLKTVVFAFVYCLGLGFLSYNGSVSHSAKLALSLALSLETGAPFYRS